MTTALNLSIGGFVLTSMLFMLGARSFVSMRMKKLLRTEAIFFLLFAIFFLLMFFLKIP